MGGTMKAGSRRVGVGSEASKREGVRARQALHRHPLCLLAPSCPWGATPPCPGGSLLPQTAKKASRKGDTSRRKMCPQDEVFQGETLQNKTNIDFKFSPPWPLQIKPRISLHRHPYTPVPVTHATGPCGASLTSLWPE